MPTTNSVQLLDLVDDKGTFTLALFTPEQARWVFYTGSDQRKRRKEWVNTLTRAYRAAERTGSEDLIEKVSQQQKAYRYAFIHQAPKK